MIPASLTNKAKDKAKKNPRWFFVILVIAHLVAISLNRVPGQPNLKYLHVVALGVAWPIQAAGSYCVAALNGGWNRYFYLRDKTLENDALKARMEELEAKVVEFGEKARLLDQLNAINQSQALSTYGRMSARVIGRDADAWFNTIVIDRGSLSGLQKNQPVVTGEGLVGRVIEVGLTSSRVLLITDERHGAGAVIVLTLDKRLLGVLKGKGRTLCELRFAETPEKLENGEMVITSGQDQIYPRGLRIGRVSNLSGAGSIPQAVEIEPAAPLSRLETVAVLMIPPEEIRRQYNDLLRQEQIDREKQERPPDRRSPKPGGEATR
ncbi:MAG: rod shape-determining protein MreC [Blastocatellia bacterium]